MRLAAAESVHSGKILKLVGELGIGKSWLVRQFLDQINGTAVAGVGQCVSLSSPRPMAALAEMSDAFGPAFAAHVVECIASRDPIGNCLDAITNLPAGTVLMIEDVHEADSMLCDLLRLLCRRIGDTRLLLVMTFRPAALSQNVGLKEVLAECPTTHTTRVNIPPLAEDEVRLLCRQLDIEPDGLEKRCGGNPFLLVELATAARRGESGLPSSIAKSTARYLRKLTAEQRNWVELLAIAPPPHSAELVHILARAFGLRLGNIPADCELLDASRNLEFRSEIQREAVLADISEFRRMELERDVLDAFFIRGYDTINPEASLKLALASDLSADVCRLALPGALAAEARGDIKMCVSLLEKALAHAQNASADEQNVLLEAWACRNAVLNGITDETLSRVRRNIVYWDGLDRGDAAASTCLLMARLHHYRAEQAKADSYVDLALGKLDPERPSAELAMALATKSLFECSAGRAEAARQFLMRARSAASTDIGILARLHLVFAQGTMDLLDGRHRKGFRRLNACHKVAAANDMHELAARIQIEACDAALHITDLPRADDWARRGNALRDRFDANCWKSALNGRVALICLHRGDLQTAAETAQDALGDLMPPPAFSIHAQVALAVSKGRQHEEDIEPRLSAYLAVAENLGDAKLGALIQAFRIEHALLARGSAAAAATAASATFVDAQRPAFPNDMGQLWQRRTGFSVAAPLSDNAARPIRLESEEDFERASLAWLEVGYLFEAALARSRIADGDPARALRHALDEFSAIGATSGVNYVQRLAADRDIPLSKRSRKRGPYRGAKSHPLGLTRREVDILKMIVEGAPNRDIATRLSRSLRTIEHHVSNILGKMAMESRVQAALHAIANPSIIEIGDDEPGGR